MIDMPVAESFADGDLGFTVSRSTDTTRYVGNFQITPRLSASFRYSLMYGFNLSGDQNNPRVTDFLFDRSLGLHFRFVDEGPIMPAIAVGVNDLLGTGYFTSEYVVATKNLNDRLRATAGIGWGRFAGVNSFDNPLGLIDASFYDRDPRQTIGLGGQVDVGNLFRGNAALFGGVEWMATERLQFTAEYSSDAYPYEDGFIFNRNTPFNFGLAYAVTPNLTVEANYLYGSELGLQFTYAINPRDPRFPSGAETAPLPVIPRDAAAGASWSLPPANASDARTQSFTARALDGQGIGLHGLSVTGGTARVEIENQTYYTNAQAIGRTARALSQNMPAGVDAFDIVLIERGMPVTSIRLSRADIEELEHDIDGAWLSFTRAAITDAAVASAPLDGLYPRFDFGIEPYAQSSLFDPDEPLRLSFGAALTASFEPAPGVIFSGLVRQPLFGNLDTATRPSTSILPRVRSESNIYDKASPALTRLTGAWYFRPGEDLFGRVTAGYLEPMFGGLSAELLWYPLNSRFALGAEVNHVVQRDFDQLLGFRDYDVTTGHVSAYWDLNNGFTTQLDVGRYLAGDWGATLSIDREFQNGWRVGTFATLTDVPFDDFGEGSFDKGFRVTIPVNWITGQATRDEAPITIRPILRDGGARLDVDGRLYEVTRDARGAELSDGWGRFWR